MLWSLFEVIIGVVSKLNSTLVREIKCCYYYEVIICQMFIKLAPNFHYGHSKFWTWWNKNNLLGPLPTILGSVVHILWCLNISYFVTSVCSFIDITVLFSLFYKIILCSYVLLNVRWKIIHSFDLKLNTGGVI